MFEAQMQTATNGSFIVQHSDTSASAYLSDRTESFKTKQHRRGKKKERRR
jgi:hypothetical protein